MLGDELVEALEGTLPRTRTKSPAAKPQTPPAHDPLEDPAPRRHGDSFAYRWERHGLTFEVSHPHEHSDGIQALLEIVADVGSTIHWARLNLISGTARESVVNKMQKIRPEVPWRAMLERVCRESSRAFWKGEPITPLRPKPYTAPRFLVDRLLPLGESSVLYSDGGTGKSTVALAVAVAVTTNTPLPCGLTPHGPAAVLYLDWESSQTVHDERLGGLLKGLGLNDAPGIYYRRMTRALADDADSLRTEISRRGVRLVVLDSFGPACGIEPESADSAIRLFNALRSFEDVTALIVAHVSKMSADQRKGASRPFGSVYVTNLARSAWELRPSDDAEDDGPASTLGLFHRKTNHGRRFPPFGWRLNYDDATGTITIHPHDLANSPDLLARTSLSQQIKAAVANGAKTTEALAEGTGAKSDTIRRTCNRLRKAGVLVALPGGKGNLWGLAAPQGVPSAGQTGKVSRDSPAPRCPGGEREMKSLPQTGQDSFSL